MKKCIHVFECIYRNWYVALFEETSDRFHCSCTISLCKTKTQSAFSMKRCLPCNPQSVGTAAHSRAQGSVKNTKVALCGKVAPDAALGAKRSEIHSYFLFITAFLLNDKWETNQVFMSSLYREKLNVTRRKQSYKPTNQNILHDNWFCPGGGCLYVRVSLVGSSNLKPVSSGQFLLSFHHMMSITLLRTWVLVAELVNSQKHRSL